MRPDQALSLCADLLDNVTCWRNVVDQCAAFAGNHASDVKVTSFPSRRVLATNLFHPDFQFALAPQPSVGVAVAQEAARVRTGPPNATREVKDDRAHGLPAFR